MAKHKLLLDEEYDFQLIGICSSNSDYKLSWAINQHLNIQLRKGDDYSILENKEGEHLHSFYQFFDEVEHLEYYLIKNISTNFQRLIPEKDQVDYFLVIKNNFVKDLGSILEQLKEIESILTAFIFDPAALKSKSKLVF
jgi:hypothetical protein